MGLCASIVFGLKSLEVFQADPYSAACLSPKRGAKFCCVRVRKVLKVPCCDKVSERPDEKGGACDELYQQT